MSSRLLTIAVAALLALVALPSRADACSCVAGAPLCQTFWSTPLVFSGTVTEIEPVPSENPRLMSTRRIVRFRVGRTWRGDASGTIEIGTGMGGGDCGYNFVKGEQYLVFASGSPGRYSTGICSRTRPLDTAAEDLNYLETALKPSVAGRIFGTAEYQRRSGDLAVRPVVGYTVTLSAGDKQWTTTTGPDGRYEFLNIPAGTYSVALAVPDTEDVFGPATAKLVDPRGCAAADFYVTTDGRISASLVDSEGRPVPEVTLEVIEAAALKDGAAPPYEAVHTRRVDSNGVAEVVHLPPNHYIVGINIYQHPNPGHPYPTVYYPGVFDIAEARVIDLGLGERIDLAEFVVPKPLEKKSIAGTVRRPDGTPAARVTVQLMSADSEQRADGQVLDGARADAQGRFMFPALVGQRYSIKVRGGRGPGGEVLSAEAEFELRTDSPPITLVLAPSRR